MFKEGSMIIVNLNVKFVPKRAVVIPFGRKKLFFSYILHFAKFTLCHVNTIIFAGKMLF